MINRFDEKVRASFKEHRASSFHLYLIRIDWLCFHVNVYTNASMGLHDVKMIEINLDKSINDMIRYLSFILLNKQTKILKSCLSSYCKFKKKKTKNIYKDFQWKLKVFEKRNTDQLWFLYNFVYIQTYNQTKIKKLTILHETFKYIYLNL